MKKNPDPVVVREIKRLRRKELARIRVMKKLFDDLAKEQAQRVSIHPPGFVHPTDEELDQIRWEGIVKKLGYDPCIP